MKEFKGTPGPWYVISNSIYTGEDRLRDNNGYIIAECHGTDKRSNMQLIASAPELLQALQELAALPSINIEHQELRAKALIAIEKAIGV